VWAAGNDRTLATWKVLLQKSSNGGSTWTTPTVAPLAAQVSAIAVPSATNAYVVQRNSYISRTLDAGNTAWKRDYIGSGFYANAIDALDANRVVVVGDGGKVFSSTNAGTTGKSTWTLRSTGTTNHLRGVQMLSPTNWIVVGDNETILRTTDGGVTWTGSKSITSPVVSITSPAAGFSLGSTTVDVAGTASDAGVGVAYVRVALQRADGKYWDDGASAWTSSETWMGAQTSDGWKHWQVSPTIDSTSSVAQGLTIKSVATDGIRQSSATISVSSVKTKATLSTPIITDSYIKRTEYFTTYSYITPKHASGSSGTIFYFYRYEKVSGKYKWVLRKSTTAYLANSTSYPTKSKNWVKVKIGAGKWLVKAKHVDAGHYTSWSPLKYFTVH
jgi:hypothetical protein